MSFYNEQVLPRFQDKVMGRKAAREVRARVCSGLGGEVVEVGFGTGLNARYYLLPVWTSFRWVGGGGAVGTSFRFSAGRGRG